jgi:hypothetical protein
MDLGLNLYLAQDFQTFDLSEKASAGAGWCFRGAAVVVKRPIIFDLGDH